MRALLQSIGLGKLLFHVVHRPLGALCTSLREGGPFEQRRTAEGRAAMEEAAHRLPMPMAEPKSGPPLTLHVLSGNRFWYQTAFCLWTLAHQSKRRLTPIIYDDGTLAPAQRDAIARIFPAARFISPADALRQLDLHLPVSRFPALRDRWLHYPNIRKLIDPHLGATGWKLVIDSDLLFFSFPEFLVDWHDLPTVPMHAVDCESSYGYSRPLLDSLAGIPLADFVNVGLCGLNSSEFDWPRLEHWSRTLTEREGTHYFLEQALFAMLVAGRPCAIAPAADYVTCPRFPEATDCRAVMHHYVAGSKRWYFRRNWSHALQRIHVEDKSA